MANEISQALTFIQEDYFRALVDWDASSYLQRFDDRISAIYLCGSVAVNEAVRGISDVDLIIFIRDSFRVLDEVWYQRYLNERCERFQSREISRPRTSPPNSPDLLFRLRYDSVWLYGQDMTERADVPEPGLEIASRLFRSFARDMNVGARFHRTGRTDTWLPQEPGPRLRKFARLAIRGGAYLLMSEGQFEGFQNSHILSQLSQLSARYPEWNNFLVQTARFSDGVVDAEQSVVSPYVEAAVRWMDWIKLKMGG